MNVMEYKRLKDKGLIKLMKAGSNVMYQVRVFDATGEETIPQTGSINILELEQQKAASQAHITAIDEIIADVKAMDKKEE